MKFFARPRFEPITLDGRKAAAFARRQAREQARYPLLADVIAAEQPTLAQTEQVRNAQARVAEQHRRDFEARVWRESRRDYFASDAATRAAIASMWASWAGPRTCTYFRYVVDQCTGALAARIAQANLRDATLRERIKQQAGTQVPLDLAAPTSAVPWS